MLFSQLLNTHRLFQRLAKASEALLVAYTLLEISCHGSNNSSKITNGNDIQCSKVNSLITNNYATQSSLVNSQVANNDS